MKITVLIPTKGGKLREKLLSHTIKSYSNQPRCKCHLEILVVIDCKNCRNIDATKKAIDEMNNQFELIIDSIEYYGENPVWGGIKYLENKTDYILIQGDDELPAKMKISHLEHYIEILSGSVLQLPVFERTTEPKVKPISVIGQVNEYGITSNFDAIPRNIKLPFEIYNLASNRIMPINIALKHNLEEIKLIGGYGIETYLAFLLRENGIKMYFIPNKETANLHLQAERSFWIGEIKENNTFASKEELENLILLASKGGGEVDDTSIITKSLLRLSNYIYIAWKFNKPKLIHTMIKIFIEGKGYFNKLNKNQRIKIFKKAREIITKKYGIIEIENIMNYYEKKLIL